MFGDIFVSLLKMKNCTAADVARGTGISNGVLGDYKYNRKKPSQENLNKLANFFGVSVDYLLGRDPGIEKSSAENPAELEELLNSPYLRETYEKLVRMNPEELELVNAQIDLILKIRDKNPTDDARPE